MKTKRFRGVMVVFSCCGLMLSPNAMAAPLIVAARPVVHAPRDVALHEGGVLVGQVVNAQGVAIAGAAVAVQSAGKEIARVQTDPTGRFQVTGLQGGVHQVASAGQQGVFRLWAPETAPPAAQQGLMMVSSSDLVRGQDCGCAVPDCGCAVPDCGCAVPDCGCAVPSCGSSCGAGAYGCGGGRGLGNWIANHPLITAGAIGAAIAIPLALDDDDPPATP